LRQSTHYPEPRGTRRAVELRCYVVVRQLESDPQIHGLGYVRRQLDLAGELRQGTRVVWPWGESVHIEIAIPAANRERLRIQFVGGRGEPLFTTEARHEDDHILRSADAALLEAHRKLTAQGFESGHSWGAYWSRPHGPDKWLHKGARTSEALFELMREDVQDLVASHIFDALPESSVESGRGLEARLDDPTDELTP
jgi:hypothetical protein